MKQDLFEFDFELRLFDGFVEEQKKTLHRRNTNVPIIPKTYQYVILDEQKIFLYKILF